jgi:hypothetical protein
MIVMEMVSSKLYSLNETISKLIWREATKVCTGLLIPNLVSVVVGKGE